MLTDNDETILEKNNYMYLNFYRPTDSKIEDGKLICDISHEVEAASYLDCWIPVNKWTFNLSAFAAEDIELEPGKQLKRDNKNGDYLKKYLGKFFFDKDVDYNTKEYEDLLLPWCITIRLKDHRDTDHYIYLRINLHNGTVCDWPSGLEASFHYKSVDRNYFILRDKDLHTLYETRINPGARGPLFTQYMIGPRGWFQTGGDYFEMEVNEKGNILNWNEKEMKESLEHWVNYMKIGNQFLVMNKK